MDDSDGGHWPPVDDVPVADWELLELRKVIPPELQAFVGVARPVVRLSESIDKKQRRKHAEDVARYEAL